MLKNLGVVEACIHLPRFREKASRRIDGRTLMEWVIRRVTDSMRLDGVIVAACTEAHRELLVHLTPSDVPVFVGQGDDALALYRKLLERYPAEGVVRVKGDNLYVDPLLIDRLVTAAESTPGCDYLGHRLRDGRPAVHSPANVFAEWFRAGAIREADRLARDPAEREHVGGYICSHPEKFRLGHIPAPAEIDRDDLRLRIDLEEDWDHALTICEALGTERLDWRRIVRLLEQQPAMRRRMEALNREYAEV
jgi:spore coat polysaccharide biosynthesis protein SpsF